MCAMIDADKVRQCMNRAGASHTPFLFGVDFEMKHGFFFENPLRPLPVMFSIGSVTNAPCKPEKGVEKPELKAFPESAGRYGERFAVVRDALMRGDSFLLNLTLRTPVEMNTTLEDIFFHCRAPYKLCIPGRLVCFSPEGFVRIEGGHIHSYPMKGTIDASVPDAEKVLLDDRKELCEHYTITDLIRNDLNRVAASVRVNRFRYVDRIRTQRSEILQTSSDIEGVLPADFHSRLGDIVFDMLPAGSISGAPKEETLRVIRRAEQQPRGYYTGVFGYFDGEDLTSAVMIRFIECDGGKYYFRSGGGITINSRAADEYREVLEKVYIPAYD